MPTTTSSDTSSSPENTVVMRSSQQSYYWFLYGILLILRVCVSPFLVGYIHPDEYFQGGQELWFGCPPTIPWEFEPHNALRSVVPPTIMTYWPLKVYSLLICQKPIEQLSGQEILVIPRLVCAILSIICVDASIWSIVVATTSNTNNMNPMKALIALASSWPAIIMLSRPFSNSLETYIFTLLLSTIIKHTAITTKQKVDRSDWKTGTKIGVLCALGLFTRFTFVFFAFPVVVYYLYDIAYGKQGQLQSKSVFQSLRSALIKLAISFLVTASIIIYFDTKHYIDNNDNSPSHSNQFHLGQDYPFVLTPWNALSYNSKVSNLSDHGLHPRWTHALVNMFILYGPLTLIAYLTMVFPSIVGKNKKSSPPQKMTSTVCQLAIVFGLGCLSLAPHQEPRFLLPLIVPLVLVAGQTIVSKLLLTIVWVIFNVILFGLYGIVHQAGVLPSLSSLDIALAEYKSPLLIYFHTYMPPTFISRRSSTSTNGVCRSGYLLEDEEGVGEVSTTKKSCDAVSEDDETTSSCTDTRIMDLKGSTFEDLQNIVSAELRCSEGDNDGTRQIPSSIFVATSPLSDTNNSDHRHHFGSSGGVECSLKGGFKCRLLQRFAPHLSTEDFPEHSGSLEAFYYDMHLAIYEITCL